MPALANAHIVDWTRIDHVLLDMDGTILDLAFDNYFWKTLVPERYARLHQLTLDQAHARLEPEFTSTQHTLPWYCTDHWSRVTGLNMAALKREIRERITPIPGVEEFLKVVRDSGRPLWVVTNAHRDSWELKLEHTGFRRYFDEVYCSHDFGYPKEDSRFWDALHTAHPFARERALFIDDSMPVLSSAQAWGVGQVIGIRKPDSSLPERPIPAMRSVGTLTELAATIAAPRK
ncbi:GMP/IMP nucleotidase [Solimonas marina]|uniref:GMP/IMP nucleotidase n=1 Tax=Solimonas marina TaxID=2714601 RepID=A0A969W969_9GAMM|nr:GMP/IMP nucleotidase [Solimonas marina]NKF22952.1 GMP/IMP nucleotidase [Solimonas marina]